MTGAKEFCAGSNMLQFKMPRFTKNKSNVIRITLSTDDTYSMEFFYLRDVICKTAAPMISDIYFDQLQEVFTRETGFVTSL